MAEQSPIRQSLVLVGVSVPDVLGSAGWSSVPEPRLREAPRPPSAGGCPSGRRHPRWWTVVPAQTNRPGRLEIAGDHDVEVMGFGNGPGGGCRREQPWEQPPAVPPRCARGCAPDQAFCSHARRRGTDLRRVRPTDRPCWTRRDQQPRDGAVVAGLSRGPSIRSGRASSREVLRRGTRRRRPDRCRAPRGRAPALAQICRSRAASWPVVRGTRRSRRRRGSGARRPGRRSAPRSQPPACRRQQRRDRPARTER